MNALSLAPWNCTCAAIHRKLLPRYANSFSEESIKQIQWTTVCDSASLRASGQRAMAQPPEHHRVISHHSTVAAPSAGQCASGAPLAVASALATKLSTRVARGRRCFRRAQRAQGRDESADKQEGSGQDGVDCCCKYHTWCFRRARRAHGRDESALYEGACCHCAVATVYAPTYLLRERKRERERESFIPAPLCPGATLLARLTATLLTFRPGPPSQVALSVRQFSRFQEHCDTAFKSPNSCGDGALTQDVSTKPSAFPPCFSARCTD